MLHLQHRAKAAPYEDGSYLLGCAVAPSVIATSNSLKTVKLYSVDDLAFVGELKGHNDPIFDLRFNPADPNCLLTCGGEGTVVLWDVRALKPHVLNLELNAPDLLRSGDIACDGSKLALGDGVDTVVYDMRKLSEPVIRLECHSDEINRVRFHDTNSACLTTAAEDGLLIVLNTHADNDDDAQEWIFNVNNAIQSIAYSGDNVVCTTSCETVYIGSLTTGDRVCEHGRPADWTYVIGPVGDQMLWGVNGEGYESRVGEILVAPIGCDTHPEQWTSIKSGHTDIVRFATPHPKDTSRLFTGGEDGFIASWGGAARRSQKTDSRIQASALPDADVDEVDTAPFVVVTSVAAAMPDLPPDMDEPIYTGDCVVTVSPLTEHKARKGAVKKRISKPY